MTIHQEHETTREPASQEQGAAVRALPLAARP